MAIIGITDIIHINKFAESSRVISEYNYDEKNFKQKIILIPLDSRPPCKDFVVDLGKISDIDVITPPSKLLDYFTIAGETDIIKNWILENTNDVDAIILSIDQIVSGGLIASREKILTDSDINSLNEFVINLRSKTKIPIYAFYILPRTQPQQSIDNYHKRRALNAYSKLMGLSHAGLSADEDAIFETLSEVDRETFNDYIRRFEMSEKLSQQLIKLVINGNLDRLIIGLDDGEEYSIQNITFDNLNKIIQNKPDKISLIHGADEIAQTLLTEFAMSENNQPLKVCIKYNRPETSSVIMPYMAIPIEKVVQEKVNQLNLEIVETSDDADFILYISVDNNKNISSLFSLDSSLSIVDLSTHFDKSETLLPVLIEKDFPINSLTAYAGWNTASNAIGTAISQSILYKISQKNNPSLNHCLENLRFLNQRIIEDQIYLKDGIDTVNHALKKSGSYDTSYLDFGTEYEYATFIMRTVMDKKIDDFKYSESFSNPVEFKINDEEYKISLKDFDVSISYPWARTFEIRLNLNNIKFLIL